MSRSNRPLRDRLRRNYTYLIDELTVSNYVNDLYQAAVLSVREKDELLSTTDRHKQAQIFVDTMMRKSEPAIQKFLDILQTRMDKQPHIYEVLFPEEKMTGKPEHVKTSQREDQQRHSRDASLQVFDSLEKMNDDVVSSEKQVCIQVFV